MKKEDEAKKVFSFGKTTVERPLDLANGFVDHYPSRNSAGYPYMFTPKTQDVDVFQWVTANNDLIQDRLNHYGAVLFRKFQLTTVDLFNQFISALQFNAEKYNHRSSPRHEVKGNIYTSTDHPEDQVINMHNEHSYSFEWPLRICFFGLIASIENGETPIADSRKVLGLLSERTRKKFCEKGVRYVRNLGTGMGMTWMEAFQATDRSVVEKYCTHYGIRWKWLENERLRLEFERPAIRIHPITKEETWFNHAFFFNVLSLEKDLQEMIVDHVGSDIFPFLTFYGDGSSIEGEVIEEIRNAFEITKVDHKWMAGDVLLLDNMLMAHGRNKYSGNRKILVAMMQMVNDNGLIAP